MSVLDNFPDEWLVDVTITRGQERDRHDKPIPGSGGTHTVPGCVIAPRSTQDPVDRSELVSSSSVLYTPPDADIRRDDRFTVSGDPLNAGRWRVDGAPQPWPEHLEIAILRED